MDYGNITSGVGSAGGLRGASALVDSRTEAPGQQIRVDSQLEKFHRMCQSLAELNNRLNYVNIKVRGQVPEQVNKNEPQKEPEITLVNLSRIAEILLERCHAQVSELAAQIGE